MNAMTNRATHYQMCYRTNQQVSIVKNKYLEREPYTTVLKTLAKVELHSKQ